MCEVKEVSLGAWGNSGIDNLSLVGFLTKNYFVWYILLVKKQPKNLGQKINIINNWLLFVPG